MLTFNQALGAALELAMVGTVIFATSDPKLTIKRTSPTDGYEQVYFIGADNPQRAPCGVVEIKEGASRADIASALTDGAKIMSQSCVTFRWVE